MSIAPKQVVGVLVTYQPDEAVAARIEKHLQQLSHLIVIDNAAEKAASFLPSNKNITLLAQAENNLAAAQNLGIQAAREQGAKAVLLLDDDSELGEGALEALCAAYERGDGLIAPMLMEQGAESKQAAAWLVVAFRRSAAPTTNAFTPIASGSLIPLSALEQVGMMDESLGIDYVDRDFCLRLLQRGLKTKVIAGAQLYHQLGHSQREALGITTRNHSPARRRSIFCNRLRLWARYGLSFPSFLVYDVMAAGYDIIRIAVFEDEKRAKLRAALKGVGDAIYRK